MVTMMRRETMTLRTVTLFEVISFCYKPIEHNQK